MTDLKWKKADNKRKRNRPSWDAYFMKIAMLVAERATCKRHKIGAVIVKNKRILSTGYNGAPAGVKDCLEIGCIRDELKIPSGTRHEVCRAIHSEQNAIIQAALHGVDIDGGTLYTTHTPCNLCAKMIVNARIKRVVSYSDYPDKSYMELFKATGIEFVKIKKPGTTIIESE